MVFSKNDKLEEDLLFLIGKWSSDDREGFRTILNNAIDICENPHWLITKLAIHAGHDPKVIRSWAKGAYWPGEPTRKSLIELIKQLIIT